MPSVQFQREIAAKGVARSSTAAAAISAQISADQACPYPAHRTSDWQLAAGGPVVCGVCHPPAPGLEIELVAS